MNFISINRDDMRFETWNRGFKCVVVLLIQIQYKLAALTIVFMAFFLHIFAIFFFHQTISNIYTTRFFDIVVCHYYLKIRLKFIYLFYIIFKTKLKTLSRFQPHGYRCVLTIIKAANNPSVKY